MKRLVIGMLLAAVAFGPVGAEAQRTEMRVDPEDRPRLTPEQREQRRAERAARRAERGDSADRPRRERPDRRLDGDGMREARPDRVVPRRDGQVFPPIREQRRGAREERRERREERRDDRQDRREDRRDDRRDWRDDRREWREDRRDWSRNSGWSGWGRDAYRGGLVWNRGWRNDRRYDWNGWRERNRGAFRLPRYYAPSGYGYQYRRFGLGATLSRSLFAPDYWIGDPRSYRLPPAYGPYRWVRYYHDALLIDLRTGRVVDLVHGIFY